MKVKLLKACNHETLGALKKDAEVDVDPSIAKLWESLNACKILESKPVEAETPLDTKVIKNEYKGKK